MSATVVKPASPGATLEDLLALPEEDRYELVNGDLVQKEAAQGKHGEAQLSVGIALRRFRRRGGPPDQPGGWRFATEVLVQFLPGQVRRPDVAGWKLERLPAWPEAPPILVIPDWVCEVLAPTNASSDTIQKMGLYHQAKVPHYWLLDPRDETLAVYRWTLDGYLFVLGACRSDRVRAEPFAAIELAVGLFFGEDEEGP